MKKAYTVTAVFTGSAFGVAGSAGSIHFYVFTSDFYCLPLPGVDEANKSKPI